MERWYSISSLSSTTDDDAKRLSGVIRTHWEIANRVYWLLDSPGGGYQPHTGR